MEPTSTKSSEDMEKRDLELKLREEVLALRVKELIPLRDEVRNFRLRFMQVAAVITVIMVLLGFKWWELSDKIDKAVYNEVTKKTQEAIRFGERLQQALHILNSEDPRKAESAVGILEDLAEERCQNELCFSYLMESYIRFDDCLKGYYQLKKLEKKGLKTCDFEMSMSLRNYGFLLWLQSLEKNPDQFEVEKGIDFLKRSLKKARQDGDEEGIRAAAQFLVLVHLSRGDREKAEECALKHLKDRKADWEKYVKKRWFEKLKKRHRNVREDLREMFPGALMQVKMEVQRR